MNFHVTCFVTFWFHTVEDTENIVDVDDGHTYGRTWFDIVSRGTIGGGNVRP